MEYAESGTVELDSGKWHWTYQPVVNVEDRSVSMRMVYLQDPDEPKNTMEVNPPFGPSEAPDEEDFYKSLRHPRRREVIDRSGEKWIFRSASHAPVQDAMAGDVPDVPYRATFRSPDGDQGSLELPPGKDLGDLPHGELIGLAEREIESRD